MSAAAGGTSDQLYEPCCASRARGVGTAPPSLANLVRSYKCAASCTPEFVVGWSIYGSVWKGGVMFSVMACLKASVIDEKCRTLTAILVVAYCQHWQ